MWPFGAAGDAGWSDGPHRAADEPGSGRDRGESHCAAPHRAWTTDRPRRAAGSFENQSAIETNGVPPPPRVTVGKLDSLSVTTGPLDI